MNYIKLPKELFKNPKYQKLSANAKLLYGLLLDRRSLSKSNNLTDGKGAVVVYFKRDEAAKILGIGRESTYKIFAELTKVGLLEQENAGVGKARILYVKNPTCKVEKHAPVRSEKPHPNKTELNNTELNKTDLNNIDPFFYTVLPDISYTDEGMPF